MLWREQVQQDVNNLLTKGRLPADAGLGRWQDIKQQRQQFLQRYVQSHASLLGEARKTPIVAEIRSEKPYDGFRVQNIVFESLPSWQVGLNLFLPLTAGPYVPIMCPCGHGPKWFDDHQTAPQVLARHGFAAALFDAPMFGEKEVGNSHWHQGAQTQLVGLWSNLFFIADVIRTGDYLETRDDLDFSNGMGVTGVSGGGFTTMVVPHLDPRVKAIAPVCSLVGFGGHVLEGLYTGCPEYNMEGQALAGFDIDDFVGLAAPLPTLVMAGTHDELFREAEVRRSFAKAQQVYELENSGDRLALFFDECPHKYTVSMANQAAQWFNRWLRNGSDGAQSTLIEQIELLSIDELKCGIYDSTGHMQDVARREAKRLKQERDEPVCEICFNDLLHTQRVCGPTTVELIAPLNQWGPRTADGRQALELKILHTEDELPLPLLELEWSAAPAGTLVGFSDRNKFELLRQNGGLCGVARRMVAADLRGFGELAPEASTYDVYGWCSIDKALADLLFMCGDSPFAQQVHDALRVLDYVASDKKANAELMVFGEGEAALAALIAGVLHPHVKKIALNSFLCSFQHLIEEAKPTWSRYQVLPNVLRVLDIPELLQQHTEKQFLLMNPRDGRGRRLDEIDALHLYGMDAPHISVHVDFDESDIKGTVEKWLHKPEFSFATWHDVDSGQAPRMLPTRFLGADLVGLNEARNVQQVIASRTLFRHYGNNTPIMADALEKTVQDKFGSPFVLALSSGSAALHTAIAALGIGPGDEVLLPAFSWFACYNAIVAQGALPVFCDIDRSLNIDVQDVERKITSCTKAILVVHYQGGAADMDSLMALASRHNLKVIEDVAQAFGGQHKGRFLGTIGDVGTFSFQSNKVLACGEGGLMLTRDANIFARAVRYHDLGVMRPAFSDRLGEQIGDPMVGNQYRMSEVTAAVGVAQFEKLDWILGRCRGNWHYIREHVQKAVPQARYRLSYSIEGDAGITLFMDLGSPDAATAFTAALKAQGVEPGASSGMVNLLTQEYVQAKRMVHPDQPPFGPGFNGESVSYPMEIAPRTTEYIDSLVAMGIGPRFTHCDAQFITRGIINAYRQVQL